MDYLAFWLLVLGGVGYVFAVRKQIKETGHKMSTIGFPSYGYLAICTLIAGIVLCFVKFGLKGFLPVIVMAITMRLATSKRG